MAWLRISDSFHDDPMIEALGNEAAGAFVRLLAYCADHSTDGFIAAAKARSIAKPATLERLLTKNLLIKVVAGELQEVTGRRDSGRRELEDVLVRCIADGYFAPKFLHYNRSKAERGLNASPRVHS